MTTTRPFCCDDFFRFGATNMDPLTETYTTSFYLSYLARWPGMCSMQEGAAGRISSYMIGKAEGRGREWHGHVSALTVAPEFRRLGLAKTLMAELERVSDKACVARAHGAGPCGGRGRRAQGRQALQGCFPHPSRTRARARTHTLGPRSPRAPPGRYNGYFVDLYVRAGNTIAARMYTALGYSVYRRVLSYYQEPLEDALDMRKRCPRDVEGKSTVPLPAPTEHA